jgi:SNF2 family DNA or RNA helicase
MAKVTIRLMPATDAKFVKVLAPYDAKNTIKAINGRRWNAKEKVWEFPLTNMDDALKRLERYKVNIDDVVNTRYKALTERNAQAVEIKEQADAERTVQGLKGTLYPYQAVGKEFLHLLQQGEGAVLAFDMGGGKSLTSIAEAVDLLNNHVIDHVLVVCPASLKYATWEAEIKKWSDRSYIVVDGEPFRPEDREVEIIDPKTGKPKIKKFKGKPLREIQYQQDVDFMIMNYELFLYDMDIIPKINGRWAVICDEAHRIKSVKAQTTKNLIRHCEGAARKFLLSGTPLENKIEELWSIINFARKGLLGTYSKFEERYLILDYWGTPVGFQRKDELLEKIAPIIMRRKKSEMNELPPLTEITYWVEMDDVQKKLYKTLRDGILETVNGEGEDETTYLTVLAQLTRIQQLLDSPALLRDLLGDPELPVEGAKLRELGNILEDINVNENKTIVFSQYKEMTDILNAYLVEKYGREAVRYIHGGVNNQLRGIFQDEFQENPKVRIMLITTAGNYGLNLFKASYVVCYDQLFNPQKMNQIVSRAHRNGATQPVTAIYLMTRGTYEERKLEILNEKKALFAEMIDREDLDDTAFQEKLTTADLLRMVGN